jgi:sterol desaturase/sphingolipid hydroxylase (fatty acid hydroxylase superfamily)
MSGLDSLHWYALVTAGTLRTLYTQPGLYVASACFLLLEWWLPAEPSQRPFRVGLAQDFVWMGIQTLARVFVIAAYVGFLSRLYQTYTPWLTITAVAALPTPLKWTLWILAIDVLDWGHHWVKHKVPWFWHFHAVHHSQTELNLFTDMRYHSVEYLVSRTLVTFPLLVLQTNVGEVLYLSLIHQWYSRFVHASSRTNLGPLRYLLVTPQSHRVHHSIEVPHHDKNFGVIFSIWDRLFGTQYRGYDEYPPTGIPDAAFPLERSAGGGAIVAALVRQHLYPFQAIARSLRPTPAVSPSSAPAWSARSWRA